MRRTAHSTVEALTRREREVLALLAEGLSAPEIARSLSLALSTVKFHLDNIYSKLGVGSKRQALDRAKALGLLAAPAGRAAAAPPGGLPRHNLPLAVTRFFGRAEELKLVGERLAEWRLVTLTGPGGVGKTRLALRFAEEHQADFADGVCLVELAPLADASLVPQAVASALGVRDQPSRSLRDNLVDFLGERQLLLLLDNCEHVLSACAPLAESLLQACPRVVVLATSREALGIAGEALCVVPSLAYPAAGEPPPAGDLAKYDAIQLLLDRARTRVPGYTLAEHNADALARICQRLDGLPLALEMAASRLNTLAAEQLDSRLDDALTVLANGRRTALPRHQTLQATLDWSFALLNPAQRVLLRRLSVFSGGALLEAVEGICSDAALPEAQVLGNLGALVEQSMVVMVRQPGQPARYRMLETVRQYASKKLAAADETRRLRARHRDYYLALAEASSPLFKIGQDSSAARVLLPELDNLRLALEWSFEDAAQPDAAPRILSAVMMLWPTHREGLAWTQRGAAWCEQHAEIPWAVHYCVLSVASTYCALNEPWRATQMMERAVAVCRAPGADRRLLLRSLRLLAWRYACDLGELEPALRAQAEAEAVFAALDPAAFDPQEHVFWQAWLSSQRAGLELDQGDFEAALAHASLSLPLYAQCGQRASFQHADAQRYLGQACVALGDYSRAEAHFRQSQHAAELLHDNNSSNRKISALRWLGWAARCQGDWPEALAYAQSSIRLANEWPDYNLIASNLTSLAALMADAQQPGLAATLAGAAAAMFARQQRRPRLLWEPASLEALWADWQTRPDQAALAAAFEAGQLLTGDEVVALALQATLDAP